MKKSDLKYLIQLVDDEEPEVRNEVLRQLSSYGNSLELDLKEYSSLLDAKKEEIINPIILNNRHKKLREDWLKLQFIKDEATKLEFALRLIACFQSGGEAFTETLNLLDETALDFLNYFPGGNEIDLAKFLFQIKGLRGNKDDYYNPLNSNILFTLKERKGIPITLCSIYILIGKRTNMNIEGCNFPGHFLAKIYVGGELILVDCYNRGKLIYNDDLEEVRGISPDVLKTIVYRGTNSTAIIRRVVNNLINAYHQKRDSVNEKLFDDLLNIEI